MSDRLFAATRKGLFEFRRNGARWGIKATAFLGSPVSMMLADPRDGVLYAALDLGHFGVKLHRSDDGGESWTEIGTPSYAGIDPDEADAPALKLIWSLEAGGADEPGVLWAGTIPGGLFRSADRGQSWSLVRGLWDDPSRKGWFGGGYDKPGIHSVLVHPHDPRCITVAISTDTFYANGQGPTLIKWVTALAQAFPDMAAYIGAASVHLYNNGLDPTSLEAGNVALVVSTLAADNVSVPVWVTETGSNATAISAAYFSAAPRTIVPLAWVVQGNFATSTLDNLNSLATTDNIQRVYSFSFSRSASQTAWTWADPIDSGWLLEGPTGQVRGAGTAVFSWVAAHQPVAAP